jgi:hypothetical protein
MATYGFGIRKTKNIHISSILLVFPFTLPQQVVVGNVFSHTLPTPSSVEYINPNAANISISLTLACEHHRITRFHRRNKHISARSWQRNDTIHPGVLSILSLAELPSLMMRLYSPGQTKSRCPKPRHGTMISFSNQYVRVLTRPRRTSRTANQYAKTSFERRKTKPTREKNHNAAANAAQSPAADITRGIPLQAHRGMSNGPHKDPKRNNKASVDTKTRQRQAEMQRQ